MFGWIKSEWCSFKRNQIDQWNDYTIYDFRRFINVMGNVSCTILLITLVALFGGSLIAAIWSLPLFAVWLEYYLLTLGLPNFILFFGFLVLDRHVAKWCDRDAIYWDESRVNKLEYFWGRAFLWTYILWFICGVILTVPLWGHPVFTPVFLPNVVAVNLMVKDLFWLPTIISMLTSGCMQLFTSRYKQRLYRDEIRRMMNREKRRRGGSMPDTDDEDVLLDHKLERLGL